MTKDPKHYTTLSVKHEQTKAKVANLNSDRIQWYDARSQQSVRHKSAKCEGAEVTVRLDTGTHERGTDNTFTLDAAEIASAWLDYLTEAEVLHWLADYVAERRKREAAEAAAQDD